jgi:hypothetical protein
LIEDYIMEDSSSFASFMYTLIMNLIGGEDRIWELVGMSKDSYAGSKYDGHFLEDEEDFDE